MVQEEGVTASQTEILAKKTIYDSVFTHLFGDTEYTLQLYKALHPEDAEVTKDEIDIVTLENVFLNQPYNDLGFTVGNRLMFFVEAQSTWSANIVVRSLMYLAQTVQKHIIETKQNVYGSKHVSFPEPEFYVIYIGNRKRRPGQLTLSGEFFGGRKIALEITVKVIYEGKENDIISQYITFTRVYREQCRKYGRTRKAVLETIRICKDQNVLKSYLEKREKEVFDIMMTLFDREWLLEVYVEEERQAAAKKAAKEAEEKGIIHLVEMCKEFGLSLADTVSKIATAYNLSQADSALTVKKYW